MAGEDLLLERFHLHGASDTDFAPRLAVAVHESAHADMEVED